MRERSERDQRYFREVWERDAKKGRYRDERERERGEGERNAKGGREMRESL